MSRRKPKPQHQSAREGEPLILWWMPVVALLAPVIAFAWTLGTADGDAVGKALFALVWPGVPLYLGTIVVLWGGWKIELE